MRTLAISNYFERFEMALKGVYLIRLYTSDGGNEVDTNFFLWKLDAGKTFLENKKIYLTITSPPLELLKNY